MRLFHLVPGKANHEAMQSTSLVLKYEDSISGCYPGLVRYYHVVIPRYYHHSSAFHPYYCSILDAELHVYDDLPRWILDPQAMQFEPSHSLAVLQQQRWLGADTAPQ